MGQKFAACDAEGNIVAYYDDIDSPVPAGVTNVIRISDAQWRICISQKGWTVQNGALVAPAQPTAAQVAAQQAAQAWSAIQQSARAAIADSDITVLRCYESAVQLPAAWTAYRKSLRAIISASTGDATQPLPVKPPYPSGT